MHQAEHTENAQKCKVLHLVGQRPLQQAQHQQAHLRHQCHLFQQ
jgi:hypothetical protein